VTVRHAPWPRTAILGGEDCRTDAIRLCGAKLATARTQQRAGASDRSCDGRPNGSRVRCERRPAGARVVDVGPSRQGNTPFRLERSPPPASSAW